MQVSTIGLDLAKNVLPFTANRIAWECTRLIRQV
jgi:hypothetical protein